MSCCIVGCKQSKAGEAHTGQQLAELWEAFAVDNVHLNTNLHPLLFSQDVLMLLKRMT